MLINSIRNVDWIGLRIGHSYKKFLFELDIEILVSIG